MKGSKRRISTILSCLLCLLIVMLVLVACNKDACTVTLDANGGTLHKTSVTAEKGASILDAVGDIVPKADGLIFDTWLINGQPLSADDKVTGDVTLVASYKTVFRAEVYLQNSDKTAYVKDDAKTVVGYGKVGETVTPEISGTEGYALNTQMSSPASATLVAGENLLKYYFARADRRITYANVGDGGEETVDVATYSGASQILADCTFEGEEGMTFIGWSESATVGTSSKYLAGSVLEITGDVKLYAQWGTKYDEAYMSGATVVTAELTGADGNYGALLTLVSGEKILGTYDGITKFFTAGDKKGIVDDASGQFIYDVTGKYVGYNLLGNATDKKYGELTLDATTGEATYKLGADTATGTYTEVRTGTQKFTGEKHFVDATTGTEFYFTFLTPEDEPSYDTATYDGEFFRKGEEAGRYVVVDLSGGEFESPYKYQIELDGYGNMDFYVPALNAVLGAEIVTAWGTYVGVDESLGEWQFIYEDQLFEDTNKYPRDIVFKAGHLKSIVGIVNGDSVDGEIIDDIPLIVYKNEALEGVYENSTTGAKIEMDGYGNAVYTSGTGAEPIEGYVSYKGIAFDGSTEEYLTQQEMTEYAEKYSEELEGRELTTLNCYWELQNSSKAIEFVYDEGTTENKITVFCNDTNKTFKHRYFDFTFSIDGVKSFVGVDEQSVSGTYTQVFGEEDRYEIELQLYSENVKLYDEDFSDDGYRSNVAKLYLRDTQKDIRSWFATGLYEIVSDGEYHFTLGTKDIDVATSLAYMGVAVDSFDFRLLKVDGKTVFTVRDATFDDFTLGEITVDGYDKLTDGGVEYTYQRLDNGVIKATNKVGDVVLYIADYSTKTLAKSQPDQLVGEYLTVVVDNALYIGPGKLLFDGNGKAKFYEMANGKYIGEGIYTYDSATKVGKFVTTGAMQFYVESFEFGIDRMKDVDGTEYDVYIKYDASMDMVLSNMLDDDGEIGDTLTLNGLGRAIYDDGAGNIVNSRYTMEPVDYEGMAFYKLVLDETGDRFLVDFDGEMFAKERALGNYFKVVYDSEEGAYMLNEENMLLFLCEDWAMGYIGDVLNPEPENKIALSYYIINEDMTVDVSYNIGDGDDAETVDITVKLTKLPAYDEFNGDYFADAYIVYDELKEATYTCADGSNIVIDGYGEAVYTTAEGTVYNVPFYNVEIAGNMVYLQIDDATFDVPTKMLTAKIDSADNTFETFNHVGTYARFKDDDFYFPLINFYEYDEEVGDNAFLMFATATENEQEFLVPYAKGKYTKVGENEYELQILAKADDYDDLATVFPSDTFRIKVTRISNSNGEYACYIIYDASAKGDYTFNGVTYTLDGYGAVTTSDGKQGEAQRIGDMLILSIESENYYYKVGESNALTQAEYIAYIEYTVGAQA